MTPAQLDHLARIKRHLETLLANAEERTPGNAEAGWKSTLAAIEVILNCNANSFPHIYAAVQVAQMADSILTAWPIENLP